VLDELVWQDEGQGWRQKLIILLTIVYMLLVFLIVSENGRWVSGSGKKAGDVEGNGYFGAGIPGANEQLGELHAGKKCLAKV
jgi:hypothetical protein